MTYALWIVQGLLALIFLFAGGVKLVLPLEVLTKQMPLPGLVVCAAWCADETGGEAGDTAPGDTAPGRAAPAGPAGRACALQPARPSAANRISRTPASVLIMSPSPSRPRDQIRPF